ncbi:aminopeptidase [Halarchaeum sp. P4]|uniref:aminopeptidase n=1 Tax=Halarchaeum sp. P4 TaxID=3421639 RepID=UPI003EBD0776
MDPRIREHARVLVDHCTDVGAGDMVVVNAPACADDLTVALHAELGARGARSLLTATNRRAERAYLRELDPEAVPGYDHVVAALEAADVHISVLANENTSELSDVPPAVRQADDRAAAAVQEAAPERRVLTQHPASGDAQTAEMSTEAYAEFVYDAVNRDWAAQREYQARLVERLNPAEEVRIVAGDGTDLSMSVAGMDAVNDAGEQNMPGGEVFTAPVPESVAGTVHFDYPVLVSGHEVVDATLTFADGEVVDFDAARNAAVLGDLLETDAGARRVGELGVGMNDAIDRFTRNMLFDEKMAGTVHLALGRSIPTSVGENEEGNVSAVHQDMLLEMGEGSRLEIDGETVQTDGEFVF